MENIYGVSKGEKIIQIFNEEHVLNANFHQSINNAAILTFEVDEPIQQDVEFFLVRDPINDVNRDEFMYFQLTDTESDGYTWTYRAEEYAYHELSSIGYVKKIYTPDSVSNATELLEDILYNDVLPEMANRPQWRVDKTDISLPDTFPGGNSTYTLWYNHPLRGIQKFIEYFGGEVRFFVTIVNNKIDSRWVQVLQQRGRKTGKRYESNSNLISLSNKSEYTNRYQYIVPLADGAGDNGDEEKGDTPNGYSNYMTLSGLEVGSSSDRWYKPADQLYVSLANDKNADEFPVPPEGLSETPTIAPVTFSDISDKQALFDAAIEWLWENTQVAYSYSASVFDIGESQIGDTIAIIDEKTGLSSYVRVHDIDYDLVDPQNTGVNFGSNWGSSNDETIGDIVNGVIDKGEQNAGNVDSVVRSANGKNTNYYGSIEPSDPIEGDLWYWNNNNQFGIKIYHNGQWEDVIDSSTGQKIADAVNKALQDAKDYADELDDKLSGNLSDFRQVTDDRFASFDDVIGGLEGDIVAANQSIQQVNTDLGEQISVVSQNVEDVNGQLVVLNNSIVAVRSDLGDEINTVSQRVVDVDGRLQTVNQSVITLNDQYSEISQTVDGVVVQLGNKTDESTVLALFNDNFALGIADNTDKIISGINGDSSGLTINGKKLVINADTTFTGSNFMSGALIKDLSVTTGKIANLAVTSAKISELDVDKLSGNITNFVNSYWSDPYNNNLSVNSSAITFDFTGGRTRMDQTGFHFFDVDKTTPVGVIGSSSWANRPDIKGIRLGADLETDYVTFSSRNESTGNYSVELTLFTNPDNIPDSGRSTKYTPGLNVSRSLTTFGNNIIVGDNVVVGNGGRFVNGEETILAAGITTQYRVNNKPGIFYGNYVTGTANNCGIVFTGDEIYFVQRGFFYALTDILFKTGLILG